MLKLEDYETIFVLASLVGTLLIASPALIFVFPSRAVERFSELYVLGPNRMAEGYPFNLKANETYRVFLGIGNHMGSSAYYVLYVKFRNQTEPLPNCTSGAPSSLQTLYEYRILVPDGETWETLLTFSFPHVSCFANQSLVRALTINDLMIKVEKPALWDFENDGYYYQLFFELWIYNVESADFQFHNRFVGIWLNATASQ